MAPPVAMIGSFVKKQIPRAILLSCCLAHLSFGAPETELCQLHITVEPKDTVVLINGVIQRAAPLTLTSIKPGEHLLVARKQGYRELRRTITLAPKERSALQLKMDPLLGLVLVHSTPTGAEVQINGGHRGKTPMLLPDLPLGEYRMKLIKPGFRPKEIDLVLKDRTPRRIEVSLSSDSATLIVNSQPSGASLKINGLDKGTTPARLGKIPEGNATIEVTMDGYEPYKETLRLSAGTREDLNVVLKAIPSQLTVVSIPPKARIYVKNEFRGEAPITMKSLPPGTYRVRAELKDFETVARNVQLGRATKVVEEFRLQGNIGVIEVTTMPPDVKVIIDGKLKGTTQAKANPKDKISEPLKVENIVMGKHNVILKRKGYAEKRFSVEVEKNLTASVQHKLKRRFSPDYEVQTPSGTYRGVLVWVNKGNVKMEIAPGVFKVIPASKVRRKRALPNKE